MTTEVKPNPEFLQQLAEGVKRGQFAGLACARCGYLGEAIMIVDRRETLPNGAEAVYSHSGCPNCDNPESSQSEVS